MSISVSRRDLLAGSAVLGLGAVAAGTLNATAAQAVEQALDVNEPDADPIETYDCDFVVAGSGTAGLCAAIRAAELGLNTILVDAATENAVGGNSRYVENCGEVPEGGADELYRNLVDYHRFASNAIVTRKFANDAQKVIDWTRDNQGVVFKEGRLKYEEDDQGTNGGKTAIYTMFNYAKDLGVTFLFDERAYKLLTNDEGAIAGLKCKNRIGEVIQINTPAVDLCTGGFAANKEMFERFTNVSYDRVIARGITGTQMGDGITMGEQLGAQLFHPEAINYCSPILPGHYNKGALTICGVNQADTCFFNESGRRFCDEEVISDWTTSGNICSQQHHIYMIVDQDFVQKIMDEGVVTKRHNYFEVGEPVPQFQDEIDAALTRENPRVYKADTLEELCANVDIDAEALIAEVEKFNGFVDAGFDADFMKTPEYLRKIQTPPFYLFRSQLAFYNSVGGLRVDEFARVIGSDYKPIPGLYAGGSDAGALFGPYYDVSIAPGSTQLWGRVSGYWAAEHAANEYLA